MEGTDAARREFQVLAEQHGGSRGKLCFLEGSKYRSILHVP
jgi:hypothetical protein